MLTIIAITQAIKDILYNHIHTLLILKLLPRAVTASLFNLSFFFYSLLPTSDSRNLCSASGLLKSSLSKVIITPPCLLNTTEAITCRKDI